MARTRVANRENEFDHRYFVASRVLWLAFVWNDVLRQKVYVYWAINEALLDENSDGCCLLKFSRGQKVSVIRTVDPIV